MSKIIKCLRCTSLIAYNGEFVNRYSIINTVGSKDTEYLCNDCEEPYFMECEIDNYKKWCKKYNKKVNPRHIKKIEQNLSIYEDTPEDQYTHKSDFIDKMSRDIKKIESELKAHNETKTPLETMKTTIDWIISKYGNK